MDRLLSVVIPTHNRRQLTNNAIASVNTIYPGEVEIVIVDDCGTEPYTLPESNSKTISLKLIRLSKNVGPGVARKMGVEVASGRFIAFLDSDDSYDPGWIDFVVFTLRNSQPQCLLMAGKVLGARPIAAFTWGLLSAIPSILRPVACRLISTFFNPFYTPSLVVSKEICIFHESLRHCEDYYSTTFAIFHAENIQLPHAVACKLGRAPNSEGGESSQVRKMFNGEWLVRENLLLSKNVPLGYKVLVLIGMLYQICRSGIKASIRLFR